MDVAIVAESQTPDEPTRDIYFETKRRGLSVRYIPIQRLSVRIADGNAVVETRGGRVDASVVVIRGIGYVIDSSTFMRRVSILKILEREGTVTINPVDALLSCRNKLETIYLLSKAGVPVPPTAVTEDLYYGYITAKDMGKVVLKPIQGSRGFGAMMFEDPEQAFQVMRTLLITRNPLYIQKYVEKPNRDIRIIVVDGRPIGCMYRVSTTWKTNIAQGAVGVPCKITPELEEIAVKATNAIGLIYSGVDIGEGREGYVVFEVNASPDWRGFKQATGVNPAVHLVDYIQRILKK
ncbi:SSU ribosomal protein S6P modification protein [Pyrobaculum islandicum DSM 4184]|uniref:SSU ribosomal protein S6P modification protein n=1 Tax=Pyrobaculum islandicum (strain DSM 4184 / JCM 9189 / GEO3) TaxID=384616 RepID=A1RSG7_PYRIL|nr:RimK family alpha-L-glutamate ligase [Pyrobaculum islandicum]ABL87899.1 SSU ribosomal protein S6P modification protein [Pyrobaculum islandicum DSM 4184]